MFKTFQLKPRLIILLLISLLLLILSACGGEAPTQDAAEAPAETVEEAVEEAAEDAEEMMEEEIGIEPESELDIPIEAESSESEGGSPFEPQTGSKAQPTRTSAEDALASVDEVRSIDELPAIVLEAQVLDDNEGWENYMLYLENYAGPRVDFVNILERHVITLLDDDGNPASGLPIEYVSNGQTVGRAVTHSDGKLFLFPKSLEPLSSLATNLNIVLSETGETFKIDLGTNQNHTFVVTSEPSPKQPLLDLVLVFDTTGSMADDLGPIVSAFQGAIDQLIIRDSSVAIRIALVEYRDVIMEQNQGDMIAVQTLEFDGLNALFSSELDRLSPSGGGNPTEMLAEGLNLAIENLAWHEDAGGRVIVLVADAPPHFPSFGLSYTSVMLEAAESGIKIHTVGATGLDTQGEYIFRQLSQYTGGQHIYFSLIEGFMPDLLALSSNSETPQNISIQGLESTLVSLMQTELENLDR